MDHRAATRWNGSLVGLMALWRPWAPLLRCVGFRSKGDPLFRVIEAGVEKYVVKGRMQSTSETGGVLLWLVHVIDIRL
jgi:hypothetical protein